MDLSFLKDVKLKDVEKTTRVTRTEMFPTNGDIKIFRNGRIFYSYHFRDKVGEGGIDFIDS